MLNESQQKPKTRRQHDTHKKRQVLVIDGNQARPQYLQYSICDASWSTGTSVYYFVRAPQKKQQQQHTLEAIMPCATEFEGKKKHRA